MRNTFKALLIVFGTSLMACQDKASSSQTVSASVESLENVQGTLPVIDMTAISDESQTVNLSDLVEDFKIIPLAKGPEFYLSPSYRVIFYNNFVFVTDGGFAGGKLFLFDDRGNFKNKIGRIGHGPGEHIGFGAYFPQFSERDSSVAIEWQGKGELTTQVFELNGEFLYQFRHPLRSVQNVRRLSDSVWIAAGPDDWGNPGWLIMDSVRLVFFKSNGTVIKTIYRTSYPTLTEENKLVNVTDLSTLYHNGSAWSFTLRGNDTLFTIKDFATYPRMILKARQHLGVPAFLKIFDETDRYLFLTESLLKEFQKDSKGRKKAVKDNRFMIIDKNQKHAFFAKFHDDLLHLFPDDIIMNFRWFQNNQFYVGLWPADLRELTRSKSYKESATAEIQAKINNILAHLHEDDNPVIFVFKLKKDMDLYQSLGSAE